MPPMYSAPPIPMERDARDHHSTDSGEDEGPVDPDESGGAANTLQEDETR
jgi:hypothetical protein